MERLGHTKTGAAAGAITAAASDVGHFLATGLGIHPAAYIGVILAGGMGGALFPDVDTDRSSFTQSLGWITRYLLAEPLQWVSRRIYAATRMRHDPVGVGEHRGFMHTKEAALLTGLIIWVTSGIEVTIPGTTVQFTVGAAVTTMFMTAGLRAFGLNSNKPKRRRRDSVIEIDLTELRGRVTALIVSMFVVATLKVLFGDAAFPPWLIGLSVTIGMLTHSAGDGCTNTGVPWKWPAKGRCDRCQAAGHTEKCARWDRSHNWPAALRFSTGSPEGKAKERRIGKWCDKITIVVTVAGLATAHLAPHINL